ncbi:MAG TPA: MBL fold metallo-hydrolase [Bryobacteraceae bacterium]
MKRLLGLTLSALLSLAFWPADARAAKSLEIYFIDVEGGQSTLVVSPSGQTLLIDAGYTGFGGRDADRIWAAAKNAGVKRIDTLLVTHFHDDHVGGVPNVIQRLPVTTFLDYGPSVDEGGKYPAAYSAAIAKSMHRVGKPGDMIPIKDLNITVVESAGKHIERKGEPNPYCAGVPPTQPGQGDELAENVQAIGVVIEFGKFRFGDLSDITWSREVALLCPENRVGKLDLFETIHHGGESSKATYGMAPRVAIMNNGPRKGGDPAGFKVIKASPGLEDLWQLHFSLAGGSENNAPDSLIANLEEFCTGQYLKVSAAADGSFTVYNQRNKFSKSYAAK